MDKLTTDTFFNGRIRVKQHPSGYRFSIDPILLAFHTRPRSGDKILDLGTGCGIIPLILAYRNPEAKICGVEVQKSLADVAALNVKENSMKNRIAIICKDMKDLKHNMVSGPFEWVVSNPPYRKRASGRLNPERQRAVARHEIKATLHDVVEAARRMLRVSGKFVAIYSAERTTDLLTQMRSAGIEPKFLRSIHSVRNTEAKLILVEGVKGGRSGMKIAAPLVIYHKDRSYTDETAEMFRP
jgi:tRNA1Val (adenine37-N6)-methyltransferase